MMWNRRFDSVARTFIVCLLTYLMVFSTFPAQAIAEILYDEPQIEATGEDPVEDALVEAEDVDAPSVEEEALPPVEEDDGEAASPAEEDEVVDEALPEVEEDGGDVAEDPAPDANGTVADDAATAEGDSDIIASGTWGTCPWEISADGVLTVHPGEGVDAGYSGGWPYYNAPWNSYKDSISSVSFLEEDGEMVIAPADLSGFLSYLPNVVSIDLSGLDTSAVTNMGYMFSGCSSLASLDVSGWDVSNVTSLDYMFSGCSSLASLDVSGWDVSNVASMYVMFSGCSTLASLDLSSWDTSAVTSMGYMFSDCSSLASLDLSSWDTSAVTYMGYMFSGCSKLASLDLSGWDVSNVTSMGDMFYSCSSLASLDVSGWDVSNVASMSAMFSDCSSLASLDVSGWDVSNVANLSYLFYNCSSLASLDLSSWDTSAVTSMGYMFYGCSGLKTVYVEFGWSTDKVTDSSYMFSGCSSLVGGNGTRYDWSHYDKTYARIDAPGEPGYLTYKGASSGIWGTCPWQISDDGVLTVHPGIGADQDGRTASPWGLFANDITSVAFIAEDGAKVVAPADSSYLLYGLSNMRSVDFSGLDTPSVTNMGYMLSGCSSLSSLDLSGWDTSTVVDMRSMFSGCSRLATLDLTGWDTSNVENMAEMFNGCSRLSSLDLSGWDVSSVTSMSSMFYNCSSLASLDVSDWDTSSAADMGSMFYGCTRLATFDPSGWDTSSATNMSSMFNGCSKLTSLDLSGWDTSKVTDMGSMFYGCSSLGTLDLSGWDTSLVGSMYNMFQGCSKLAVLSLSGWDTPNVTDVRGMFYGCSSLASLDVSGWDTSNVTSMASMFSGCSKLASLDLSGWDVSNVASMGDMFYSCSTLASLDLSSWDTSAVTSMGYMFSGCSSLASLDVSGWDTSNVTSMYAMFDTCSSLTSLDLSGWDTFSVNDIRNMFYGCSSLETLNLSGWDTFNVTSLYYMFYNCSALESLDLSGWDTSRVTNMAYTFCNCASLPSLDLSGWDTFNVTSMDSMFRNCTSLVSIDLTGWDTSSLTNMGYMFYGCSSLEAIFVGEGWSSDKASSSVMFYGCTSLVGQNGTSYRDAGVAGGSYAHVDEEGNPGYFWAAPYRAPISGTTVDPIPDQTYTGSAFTPTITVRDGARTLVLGTDYEVAYSDEAYVGTSFITITGIGEYRGTKTVEFEIVPAPISRATIIPIPDQCYSSYEITPEVSVSDGSNALILDTDYTVTYSDNINAGTATATITGIWNYEGSVDIPFKIVLPSGTWGTCPWEIDSSGVLTVHPGTGASQEGVGQSPWADYSSLITSVVFAEEGGAKVVLPADSSNLLNGLSNVTSVDLSGLDTSSVTSMTSMFSGCSSLASLDLSGFDTSSVTNMGAMFSGCSSLSSLDLSGWDTSAVTWMSYLFNDCSSLAFLDLSGWDTSNVTGMLRTFNGCSSLASLDLSSWDTSKVTSMSCMFLNCSSLASLDVSGWNVSNVQFMNNLFQNCHALTSLDLSGWVTSGVYDMSYMFYNSYNLRTIFVGGGWSTARVSASVYMFDGCASLVGGNGTTYDSSVVDMTYARIDAPGAPGYLTRLPSGTWGTCPWEIDSSGVLTVHPGTGASQADVGQSPWADHSGLITSVVFAEEDGAKVVLPADSSNLLNGLSNVTSVDLSGLDTSGVTNMYYMFSGCSSLASLDLSGFDTTGVTSMGSMFSGCSSLVTLDLSDFDTSDVTDMSGMFNACSSLVSLDLSGFDTSSAMYMSTVFQNCYALSSLDLSSWDTSNVLIMSGMFLNCRSLKTVFAGNGWSTARVASSIYMFYDCRSIIGGNGTTYDSSMVDKTYARIDVPGTPGYFTDGRIDISTLSCELVETEMPFSYGGCCPTALVKDGDTVLVEGRDYYMGFQNNYNVGTATAIIHGMGNYRESVSLEFTIVPADIAVALAETVIPDQPYTGEAIRPADVLMASDGFDLTDGIDYTASYADNVELGTATVTIEGKGNYTGSTSFTFRIVPADVSGAAISEIPEQIYTGSAIEPAITVSVDGRELVAGTDYTVSYSDNTDIGTATVTITGIGNYTGKATVTFEIVPQDISGFGYTYDSSTFIFDGAAHWPVVTIWGNDGSELEFGVDYSLVEFRDQYGEAISDYPFEIGDYFVVYRGTGTYSGEITIWFSIVDAYDISNFSASVDKSTFAYDGNPHEPKVTVWDSDWMQLDYGVNYTLKEFRDDWGNTLQGAPTEVGSYRAVYQGLFPYYGELEVWFSIVEPNDLSVASITIGDRYAYTGSPVELGAVVTTADGAVLTEGVDYNLAYYDSSWNLLDGAPTDIGDSYSVCAEAIDGSGYTGSTEHRYFSIFDAADISGFDIDWNENTDYAYDGNTHEPSVTFIDYDGRELEYGVDCIIGEFRTSEGTVLSGAPSEVGEYIAVYQGMGSYHGEYEVWFRIYDSFDLSNCRMHNPDWRFIYDGEPHALENVSFYERTETASETLNKLEEGVDYVFVEYRDMTDAALDGAPSEIGEYYAVYQGIGSYHGEARAVFRIVDPHDLANATIAAKNYYIAYTGSPVNAGIVVRAADGTVLTKGVHYVLKYEYEGDYGRLHDEAPTELGHCNVYAVAVNGGGYTGQTNGNTFCVVEPNNLALASVKMSRYYAFTGSPVELDITVTMPGGTVLTEGIDYTLEYSDTRGRSLDGAPSDLGRYYSVHVVAVEGGRYTGRIEYNSFSIVAENDLGLATVTVNKTRFTYTGSPVDLVMTVTMPDGTVLTEGTDYELGWFYGYSDVPFDGVPIEIGPYYVRAGAIEGGSFVGFAEGFEIEIVSEPEPPAGPFFLDADPADTTNHGAEVDWMGRSGISTGWEVAGGREYRGLQQVTRCDFAAFLYRLADLGDDGARNDSIALTDGQVASVLANVRDCTPRTDHAAEIAWLISTGISKGWGNADGTVSFRPYAKVARQDMAAFLYRYADLADDGVQNQSPAMGSQTVTFSDVRHGDATNHAAEVEWLASVGVTKGWDMGNGTFQFRGTRIVARQDMAAFMYRLYTYLESQG